jgi:hypothetical protein
MGTWYGLQDIEIYRHPGQPHHFSFIAATPPALILGSALTDNVDSGEIRFLLGRAMAILQRRLTILHQLDEAKAKLLIPAIVKTVAPNFEIEDIDEASLAEMTREVGRAIPKKVRSEVSSVALECLSGVLAATESLGHALDQFADRAGLLASGGIMPALSALKRLQGVQGVERDPVMLECVAGDRRSGALLRFFVSPEHAAVREKMGLAGPI